MYHDRNHTILSVTQQAHLQEHEIKLSRCEDLLTHQTVWILLHTLLFCKSKQLPCHQTKHVELVSVRFQVNAHTLAVDKWQNFVSDIKGTRKPHTNTSEIFLKQSQSLTATSCLYLK